MRNELTRRLGLTTPLVQAPMSGGVTTPDLVAGVSEAGGLGSLGAAYMSGRAIEAAAAAIRARTRKSFAINLFVPDPRPEKPDAEAISQASAALDRYRSEVGLKPPPPRAPYRLPWAEQFEAVIKLRPAAFSFCFGIPEEEDLDRLRESGIFTIGTATTAGEARLLEDAGVDAVVAQGFEAGGHRASFTLPYDHGMIGLIALLSQLRDAVEIPVLAAGGIMNGQAIAACLALGAAAAQMGTAFLASEECGFGAVQKQALLAAGEEGTALTQAFTGKPARGLRNRFMVEAFEKHLPVAGFPTQHGITSDLRRAAAERQRPDLMAIWAGQGVAEIRRGRVADLMATFNAELKQSLAELAQR